MQAVGLPGENPVVPWASCAINGHLVTDMLRRWPSGKAALPGADFPGSPRFPEAEGMVHERIIGRQVYSILLHPNGVDEHSQGPVCVRNAQTVDAHGY